MPTPIDRKRFDVGARLMVWGRLAVAVGQFKDDPQILKFRYEGESGDAQLIITHFPDGDNEHVFAVPERI